MSAYTDAELEAAAKAHDELWSGPIDEWGPTNEDAARAVLDAVLPAHAKRVRAETEAQIVAWLRSNKGRGSTDSYYGELIETAWDADDYADAIEQGSHRE